MRNLFQFTFSLIILLSVFLPVTSAYAVITPAATPATERVQQPATAGNPVEEQLPRTGTPWIVFLLAGLLPAGLILKAFYNSQKLPASPEKTAGEIWQEYSFKKNS